ncbi:hypothetical protein [Dyella subtropica]|uniref:hypothetical protein n=1 Tax=Dyella subtropica TaxID=2992127 RepID=UPI0022562AEB|nr:hypothetical protein [Dyella subtropica]
MRIHQLRHTLRQRAAVLGLLLVMGSMATPAHAQWEVIDHSAIKSNEAGQLKQYGQLVQQYSQMVTQYTSMLTTLKSLNLNVMPVNNQLQPITDTAPLVQQACPGTTEPLSMAAGFVGLDTAELTGDIKTTQNKICQRITLLQIDKYNKVVNMLNHMNDYFAGLQQLASNADGIVGEATHAVGDRGAVQNQTSQAQTSLSIEMSNIEQQLRVNDAAIATLQAQQSMLGHIAVKGSPSLIGNAMQTIAFGAALNIDN